MILSEMFFKINTIFSYHLDICGDQTNFVAHLVNYDVVFKIKLKKKSFLKLSF